MSASLPETLNRIVFILSNTTVGGIPVGWDMQPNAYANSWEILIDLKVPNVWSYKKAAVLKPYKATMAMSYAPEAVSGFQFEHLTTAFTVHQHDLIQKGLQIDDLMAAKLRDVISACLESQIKILGF